MRKMKDTVTFSKMESLGELKMKIKSFLLNCLRFQVSSWSTESLQKEMLTQIDSI